MNRRQTLKTISFSGMAKWVSPSLTVVCLPAHAQTSCGANDIAGSWVLTVGGDALTLMTLHPDGTATLRNSDRETEWSIVGTKLTIIIRASGLAGFIDEFYYLSLDDDCSSGTGSAYNGDIVSGRKI